MSLKYFHPTINAHACTQPPQATAVIADATNAPAQVPTASVATTSLALTMESLTTGVAQQPPVNNTQPEATKPPYPTSILKKYKITVEEKQFIQSLVQSVPLFAISSESYAVALGKLVAIRLIDSSARL